MNKVTGLLLLFTYIFVSYHPIEGWLFPAWELLLGLLLLAGIVLTSTGGLAVIFTKLPRIGQLAAALATSVLFVSLIWVQLDYFTNTLWQVVTIDSGRKTLVYRFIQTVSVGLALYLCYILYRSKIQYKKRSLWAAALIPATLGIMAAQNNWEIPRLDSSLSQEQLPDIYILSVDSLESTDFDPPENFPKTKALLQGFQKAHFFTSNSCCTHGAMASLYTGHTPDRTLVVYRPGYLTGEHRSAHLPNFLKALGYTTHASINDVFGNPRVLGADGGFDFVESESTPFVDRFWFLEHFGTRIQAVKAVENLLKPFYLRYYHFFTRKPIKRAMAEVTKPTVKVLSDHQKTEYLRANTPHDGPQFLHNHYMGIHNVKRLDSEDSQKLNQRLLQGLDQNLSTVLNHIMQQGDWDNSIIIITSDHGRRWTAKTNLPLLIKPPKSKAHLQIQQQWIQMADIAPTLMNLLEVTTPYRFSGHDIFAPAKPRQLITISNHLWDSKWEAPHFQMGGFYIREGPKLQHVSSQHFQLDHQGRISVTKTLQYAQERGALKKL